VANTLNDCRESEYFAHRNLAALTEISQHVKNRIDQILAKFWQYLRELMDDQWIETPRN
jgi:hypothetical protein